MKQLVLQRYSEQDLLASCIAGNPESQEYLYSFFAPKMFGICLRYANDFHSAEDILQEGFIKAFNNLHRFRNEGSFEGWLKRIFINTSIEHYRKATNGHRFTDIDEVQNLAIQPSVYSDLGKQELLKMIQGLPFGYRTVFNLYVIEGYTHKEIAELLDISIGTSKSQLSRSRETLQKMIKAQRAYG